MDLLSSAGGGSVGVALLLASLRLLVQVLRAHRQQLLRGLDLLVACNRASTENKGGWDTEEAGCEEGERAAKEPVRAVVAGSERCAEAAAACRQ